MIKFDCNDLTYYLGPTNPRCDITQLNVWYDMQGVIIDLRIYYLKLGKTPEYGKENFEIVIEILNWD